jgi:hypothetical protein
MGSGEGCGESLEETLEAFTMMVKVKQKNTWTLTT